MSFDKWKLCSFCGELFKEDRLHEFKAHWTKCRDEYEEEQDTDDLFNNFYEYGDR